ncbi:Oidioi.mRNA.OKI2018_I69.chr1.g829.t1.cds [Oikopleura dioica]|uniref:Oidioi.mRNA.OKI2018_I69.chr1.g829.t1.cds n=1 Tax=Oikopleura dioica TaxID=34765 RepID=A0ABN7SL25_OIKDI|nr:Oidioi.mRNA.OKI2018_I69.chr1.g829.t1.cds [Oikopleura dioica]
MHKSSDYFSIASESEITESLPGDFFEGKLVKSLMNEDEDIQSISEPIFKNIDGFIAELSSLKSHIMSLEQQLMSKNQEIKSLKASLAQSEVRNMKLNEKIGSLKPSLADEDILEENISPLELGESRMNTSSLSEPPQRSTRLRESKEFLKNRSCRRNGKNLIFSTSVMSENDIIRPGTYRFLQEYDDDVLLGQL